MHPIDRAAAILGSQTALAAVLGVTKAAVGQWKDEGRRVPAEHCPVIERATSGAVRCEELRPDVEWRVLREHVIQQPDPPDPLLCDRRSGLYTPTEIVTAEGIAELRQHHIDPPADRRKS